MVAAALVCSAASPRLAQCPDLLGPPAHQIYVSIRSKWWPLPSHAAPLPFYKSKFSIPKVATLTMLFSETENGPGENTVGQMHWQVPLSDRIADQSKWKSIIEELG